MSRDLNTLSREEICWRTADCVTPLICAALVKLSVSARSQNTLRLSICIEPIQPYGAGSVNHRRLRREQLLDARKQLLARERLLEIRGLILLTRGPDVT